MRTERNRRRQRPVLEPLEGRLALSTTVPANTVDSAAGQISAPRTVTPVQIQIAQTDLSPGRNRTIFGIQVVADSGSGLVPKVVGVGGNHLAMMHFQQGSTKPTGAGQAQTVAFFKDATPGPVTIKLAGQAGTTGGFTVRVYRVGDINGDSKIDTADLASFTTSYLTINGDGLYNPAADANSNNFIGQNDGYALESNLTPLSKPKHLSVKMSLAPGDEDKTSGLHNSGAVTSKSVVTIIGRTTPGSLVFSDSGIGDYSFTGPAVYANANGYFTIHQKLGEDRLTNTEFKIVDPFGNRIIHAFPILRTKF